MQSADGSASANPRRATTWDKSLFFALVPFLFPLESTSLHGNTGIYSLELNCFLNEKGIWQSMENALQIKRSMGVVRGHEPVKDIQGQNEMLLKTLTRQIKMIDKSIKECLQKDKDLQRKSKPFNLFQALVNKQPLICLLSAKA